MMEREPNIHKGHRARMTDKLLKHGGDVFDTYELLEMLLYRVIPYKDTNPVAKLLLKRFLTLDGVLSASVSELMEVDGVGKRCAEYITGISSLLNLVLSVKENTHAFTSYDGLGEYIASTVTSDEAAVYLFLFDAKMNMIGSVKVFDGDFSFATVRPDAFVEASLRCGASAAVIAHTHPYGPLFASEGDMATNVLVSRALSLVGIPLLEHYIISGGKYIGFAERIPSIYNDNGVFASFIENKGGRVR